MSLRIPLVIAPEKETPTQQLQPGDDLDIPLATQVEISRTKINMISQILVDNGFDLPDELTQDLE